MLMETICQLMVKKRETRLEKAIHSRLDLLKYFHLGWHLGLETPTRLAIQTEGEGDSDALGLSDGLPEGDADGLPLSDAEGEGDSDALGDAEGLPEAEAADGLPDGDALGLPLSSIGSLASSRIGSSVSSRI